MNLISGVGCRSDGSGGKAHRAARDGRRRGGRRRWRLVRGRRGVSCASPSLRWRRRGARRRDGLDGGDSVDSRVLGQRRDAAGDGERRRASVEHAHLDSLSKISKRGSGEVRTSEGRRRGWISASGYRYLAGETKKTAAETRNSGVLLRRPGGAIARVCVGEIRRREWGLSMGRRGNQTREESAGFWKGIGGGKFGWRLKTTVTSSLTSAFFFF